MSANKGKQNSNMMTLLIVMLLVMNGFLMWQLNKSKSVQPSTIPTTDASSTSSSKPNTKGSKPGNTSSKAPVAAIPDAQLLQPYAAVLDKAQIPNPLPKRKVATILAQEALYILKSNASTVLLDVRSIDEYKAGHAPLSLNYPLYSINEKTGKLVLNKPFIQDLKLKVASKEWSYKTPILLIDSNGARSAQAGAIMQSSGFQELYVVTGGYDGFDNINKDKPENKIVGPRSLREITRNFEGGWLVDEKGQSEPQLGWIELGFPIITGSTESEILSIPKQNGFSNIKKESGTISKERYEPQPK